MRLSRNQMTFLFHVIFVNVALLLVLTPPVQGRPGRGQHQKQSQENQNYYGKYNRCKYEVWPWPSTVECTGSRQGGRTVGLDPLRFRIAFSPESKAVNSSILIAAFARYQELIFNQPMRISRGKLVEPQFHFEEDSDDDDDRGGAASIDPGTEGRAEPGALLTTLLVTVLEECAPHCAKTADADESYEVVLGSGEGKAAHVRAATVWGALYGLDTFSQLVQGASSSAGASPQFVLRGAPLRVADSPRYPWRGILLDTSNHFLAMDSVLRLLDAMAAAKLNVLHWHLVDSYSFPFASDKFPDLAAAGKWTAGAGLDSSDEHSDTNTDSVYTPDMVRAVVQYATQRGVRVVPEVDMPGHGYSWGLSEALRSVTTSCPRYTDELGHIDDVPLDPTARLTYEVVLGLLQELAGLFPDRFMHLGGDEVKYGCWNESASIVSWMQQHGLAGDFRALEQLFFAEVGGFATVQLGRKLVAWEEAFFDDSGGTDGAHGSWVGSQALPPATTVVEVWTGPDYVAEATRHGYDALLAYGWYLDRQNPVDGEATWFFGDSWAQMYLVDPEPEASAPAPAVAGEHRGRALGGEISMWTEQVDDLNIDSQMWPRAAAAAERLWSAQAVTDLAAAAPRLSAFRCRLVSRYEVRAGPIWSDYCSASANLSSRRLKS